MPHCEDESLLPMAEIVKWATEVLSAMDDHGRSMRVDSARTVSRLREAGFVNIEEEVIKIPINGWPTDPEEKRLGRYLALGLTRGMTALTLAPLARMRGTSRAEVDTLVEKVGREVTNRSIHAFFYL